MDQTLFEVFRENKTKMSNIDKPDMFFRHLRDNGLITTKRLDTLVNSEECVYSVLESIEKGGPSRVEKFWKCVNEKHILQRYIQFSELSKIIKTLRTSNSLGKNIKLGEASKEQGTGRKKTVKKRNVESDSLINQAGPSSQSTERKTADHVREKEEEKDLWNRPEHKIWLPVTCGEKKAKLDRRALRKGTKECIKHGKTMIAGHIFEEIGGKAANKHWKRSVLCQGKTIETLIKKGILKAPGGKNRRKTQPK